MKMKILKRCKRCKAYKRYELSHCHCGEPLVEELYAEYNDQGKRRRVKLDRYFEAKKQFNKIAAGSLAECSEWYLDLPETKQKKSLAHIRSVLNTLGNELGQCLVDRSLLETFNRWLDVRLDTLKAATLNRYISVSKSMLNTAVRYGRLPGNPLLPLKLFREDNERVVELSESEVACLIACCDESIRLPVFFAARVPMRYEEVMGLSWNQLDMKGRWISLSAGETKSGKSRKCPIVDDDIFRLLSSLPSRFVGRHVFDRVPTSTFWLKFKQARDAARINLVFHDLRHYAANRLKDQGYQVEDIMKWAGWSSMKMFHRYTLSNPKKRMSL